LRKTRCVLRGGILISSILASLPLMFMTSLPI
jgi:hypothetical protein